MTIFFLFLILFIRRCHGRNNWICHTVSKRLIILGYFVFIENFLFINCISFTTLSKRWRNYRSCNADDFSPRIIYLPPSSHSTRHFMSIHSIFYCFFEFNSSKAKLITEKSVDRFFAEDTLLYYYFFLHTRIFHKIYDYITAYFFSIENYHKQNYFSGQFCFCFCFFVAFFVSIEIMKWICSSRVGGDKHSTLNQTLHFIDTRKQIRFIRKRKRFCTIRFAKWIVENSWPVGWGIWWATQIQSKAYLEFI